MSRVLIAYDGSDSAKAAITAAGRLFAGAEAKIVVVYDQPLRPGRALRAGAIPNEALARGVAELEQEATSQAKGTADEGRALANGAGLTPEAMTVATTRPVWHEILAAADDFDARVIVSGTRGQGRLGRALLGSTSSSLLHQAQRPVLIVPTHEGATGPVVVGYDGSDSAQGAVLAVARLLPGRAVVVAHVWDWPLTDTLTERSLTGRPVAAVPEVVEILRGAAKDAAREVVEEGRALAEEHGLVARAHLVETTRGVWRDVAAAAAEADASVLAVGSRGRGGMAAALLGSVSTALAHNAERPTLMIPAAG